MGDPKAAGGSSARAFAEVPAASIGASPTAAARQLSGVSPHDEREPGHPQALTNIAATPPSNATTISQIVGSRRLPRMLTSPPHGSSLTDKTKTHELQYPPEPMSITTTSPHLDYR